MAVATPQMTADQFFALPFAPYRYQLIDGELIVDSPALPHQVAAANILVALGVWRRAAPGRGLALGSTDFRIDDHNVFQPDVWWVAERPITVKDQRRLESAPDLIVEVRSPSTWKYDRGVKKRRYEEGGVAELWLVDTNDFVYVYRRSAPNAPTFDIELVFDADSVITSPLLPGFSLPVAEIFEP